MTLAIGLLLSIGGLAGIGCAWTGWSPFRKADVRVAIPRSDVVTDVRQGVAASRAAIFAISDDRIVRRDRLTGGIEARTVRNPRLVHLNSCVGAGGSLVCAHSNFPSLPMRSSIEMFEARSLRAIGSYRIREDLGSLTWIVPRAGGWLACFANYDGRGGAPGRDHRATIVAEYDGRMKLRRLLRLPPDVLARLAPRSSSGGAIGPGGLLYVTGHDRSELYVLAIPRRGTLLRHLATIVTPTGGQAIAFDPVAPRILWSIDRRGGRVVASELPPLRAILRNAAAR